MKTKKRLLALLCLAFCPLFAFGQLKHEVKVIPLSLFSKFTPSYELILNEKFGVEVEASFASGNVSVFIPNSGTAQFSSANFEEFDRKLFAPSISGKYYFLFNKYGSGFYVGPHFKSFFNTFIEEAFEDRYVQINNTAPPYWGRKGFQNFHLGLNAGFKWLIKEHYYIKNEDGKFEANNGDFDLEIRVGYRF